MQYATEDELGLPPDEDRDEDYPGQYATEEGTPRQYATDTGPPVPRAQG